MPETVRVAVLGYGLAGRVFHCPFVSAVPGLSLEVIMQRHGDGAEELYPQARIVRSPEEIFTDPKIDLVIVATPNDTHETYARAALEAGKHVVVDKPVAPSSAGALALAEAARNAGKHLIPFHNRRWDGDFLTVQHLLQEEKLGRIVKIVSHWDRFRPLVREATWKEQPGLAHGILQDLGPHLLDQALVLFGIPQKLTASVRRDRAGSAIEDAFDLTLSYSVHSGTALAASSNPALAASLGYTLQYECHASMIAADAAPRFRVHGTHGSYAKCGLDPQEAHLVADGRHPPQLGSSVPWIEEPESLWGHLTTAPDPRQPATLSRTPFPTRMGDYRLFYAGVRDALLHDAPVPVTAIDAYRVARLIELARESSELGRTVDVDLSPAVKPAARPI